MPDLLLELFSEEIPARMQARAADDLKKLVTDAMVDRGLTYESARGFATPRRLTLAITGIPVESPATRDERKGPRIDAPEKAIEGFLRGAGLASVDDASIQNDPKKGDFYVAVIEKPGQAATSILSGVIADAIRKFPWPKSMRWGKTSNDLGSLRWVRPLQGIVATFGPETSEPEVVTVEVEGVISGDTTEGHRFMGRGPVKVRRFDDYVASLEAHKVILDPERRADTIRADATTLAFAQGLSVVEDEALISEVAGLVEWPVVLMGQFDEAFLDVPAEAIRATIRANQKCFVLNDADGKLTNRFIMVANIEASDGGKAIIAGNERVIAARLSDAKFFWDTDRKTKLEDRLPGLDAVRYHEKLGSQGERARRISKLAASLAPLMKADPVKAERAGLLAKADLVTEMVGEFPELQGQMGQYYALDQGEDDAVAKAIGAHYRPQGPSDEVPAAPESIAVALADKLDQLAGFWSIDEKPTGSKDPYALRRAALGVIRIILENKLRIELGPVIGLAGRGKTTELLAFFGERLKVKLRDDGARHDLVDAVFALEGQDDLVEVVSWVEALGAFLDTDDGANLLAAYRRAVNILSIEEKKDGTSFEGTPDFGAFAQGEERSLFAALARTERSMAEALTAEDFKTAMQSLSVLREPVDAFFDNVTVNADDPALRGNRLKMLAAIRDKMDRLAILSKVEG